MSSDKEPPEGVAPTDLGPTDFGPNDFGIEWVNLVTGHDHTNGNNSGPYFCEIHLQINLENEEAFQKLNRILSARAEGSAALDSKRRQVQDILIGELKRTRRDNESTLAIVGAIRLRDLPGGSPQAA